MEKTSWNWQKRQLRKGSLEIDLGELAEMKGDSSFEKNKSC